MIKAFSLALAQLGDRNILKLLAKTIVLTLVIFALFGALLWFGINWGIAQSGWNSEFDTVDYLAGIVAAVLAFFAGWLWFRVVAIAVLQVFGDEIVMAVERKYYAHAADHAQPVGFRRGLMMGLKSLGRALLLNLVALPLYIALLFTAVGLPIAFLIVNALLLGRDLQEMVVARHSMDLKDPRWALPFATRFGLGFVAAGLFLIPFVNLLAPIIGASMAAHLVHARQSGNSENHLQGMGNTDI